jgi:hypothetical protein
MDVPVMSGCTDWGRMVARRVAGLFIDLSSYPFDDLHYGEHQCWVKEGVD